MVSIIVALAIAIPSLIIITIIVRAGRKFGQEQEAGMHSGKKVEKEIYKGGVR